MLKTAYFNDTFVDIDKLYIHGTDLGLHRGYGVFDFLKIKNRTNPWLEWYLERLYQSLSMTRLSLGMEKSELLQVIDSLLTHNNVDDAYLKIVVTAGYSDNGYTRNQSNNLLLFAMPLPSEDINSKSTGKLITDQYLRDIPLVKTTNYMRSCILQPDINKAGATDVLYHWNGNISEASRCNIFVIKNGEVSTPADNILKGITRRRVLSQEGTGITIKERSVSLEATMTADEVFITSSTKGIMPITHIDGQAIAQGETGPITAHLMTFINTY